MRRTYAESFLELCLAPDPAWIGPVVKSRFIRVGARKKMATDTYTLNTEWWPFNQSASKEERKRAAEKHRPLLQALYKRPGSCADHPSRRRTAAIGRAERTRRRAAVDEAVGSTAPGLARYTHEVLFGDVWRQTDLAPRDRSLITVAALISQNQSAQLTFHLNRAMDNGLTREQAGGVVTHLAFYVGWPKAMSAVPVLKAVFASRGET
ncbi:carboxymuconolactone decarboxylase family protein [Pseudomonas sp. NFR16]|uniref:carboxymuconolactone decarboxylase family protein n=1 Tax=Pseudomonas sp. NFR16 TaxID=1566248 RepID=UPI00210B1380|nr:carboxymuconolactone decarboxylase family protein [Pseudomonas sp. NFR16]